MRLAAITLLLVAVGASQPTSAREARLAAGTVPAPGERFMTLKDPLIDAIGTRDTVILLCVGLDVMTHGEARVGIDIRYLAPGGKSVRIAGSNVPVALLDRIVNVAHDAAQGDPDWWFASVVVDHGTAKVTLRRRGDRGIGTVFRPIANAESDRVFPGIPVEPYKGPTGQVDRVGA